MFGKKKNPSPEELKVVTLQIIHSLSENALKIKDEALEIRDLQFCSDLFNACVELDRSCSMIIYGLKDVCLHGFPDMQEVENEQSST